MAFTEQENQEDNFANKRHIGPSSEEIEQMCKLIGVKNLNDLIEQTVPNNIRQKEPLNLGAAISEYELLALMRNVAKKNNILTSMIGQGFHGTITPPVIQRNIFENPAWYTAYTPYQPEISQGRLEALLNYQTMICDLTGLEIANASLLDEATAAAEAMTMAGRLTKSNSQTFFIDQNCHPQNIAVLKTRAAPLGIKTVIGDPQALDASKYFGAIFQYPGTHGHLCDYTQQIEDLHKFYALAILIADPLALTLLKDPGSMKADIAVGSTQRFGVPMGYGGPSAAYMACKEVYKRSMPGRLIGVSIDSNGNKAYRLSLQTREQHIRRERATSNVCTAQALLAVMASFYAICHGPKGLKAISEKINLFATQVADELEIGGFKIEPKSFFDTFTVDVGLQQKTILDNATAMKINFRKIGATKLGLTFDETFNLTTLKSVLQVFKLDPDSGKLNQGKSRIPASLVRNTNYLSHSIFNMNNSETEMMRYMRRLADRDLALDRTMIPLGSCTMKLNSAAEMMPVSWPEFSNIHPFAPSEQTAGYKQLLEDLSAKLCAITGYDSISLQPNSGAQGEYAGLLAIAAYHNSRGEKDRNICLIPVSAHGTNPASAQMAGMTVVVVNSSSDGDIDVSDFKQKARNAGDRLAAAMITYPSTHGVFEENIREICDITHAFGGQVYLDGANLNAMVGLAQPGEIGSDVSHLNLHKTFCIPHGGGGPGMGPIGVKSHLAPFLPGNFSSPGGEGPVSSTFYGSASILPISWAYCLMMGGDGLTQATRVAILNANYIAKRLEGSYKTLFTGKKGRVAHECILDTRPFSEMADISVDDIAKRLIDFGFHAPTMSWPVSGTLMVEPTESESKAELDRFCNAMLKIRAEIEAIATGKMDKLNNPLKNAPHTINDLVEEWVRPYSRKQGCLPDGGTHRDKYWPPVGRIDNVFGDRNLVCTCPPLENYLEVAE